MLLKNLILLFLLVGYANFSDAQVSLIDLEKEIAFHADVMANAQKIQHRELAATRFDSLFLIALNHNDSYTYPFDSLSWIKNISPENKTFRLFSWAIDKGSNGYTYRAILQESNGNIINFDDKRPLLASAERGNFTSKKWYGAIYFGIQTFKYDKKDAYLLLGFDANDRKTNKKIADILTFDESDGEAIAVLGAPIFIRKDKDGTEEKSRIISEYSDSSVGIMKFDRARNILVYDHMVTVFTEGPTGGAVPVPDGSYHAYELKKGEWRYVDKVFNEVSEEPPMPRPVLEGNDKDIFGRPKKE